MSMSIDLSVSTSYCSPLCSKGTVVNKLSILHQTESNYDHNTCSSPYVTLIKPPSAQSHSPLFPTCFISSWEPASYITQDSSSKLFISLSATIIWTCRFNL